LIGAVVAAIAGFAGVKGGIEIAPEDLVLVQKAAVLGAFFILAIGVATFFRIVKRDKTTDEYQAGLDQVRNMFKEQNGSLATYQQFHKLPVGKKIRKFGGTADTVAIINAITAGILVTLSNAVFPQILPNVYITNGPIAAGVILLSRA